VTNEETHLRCLVKDSFSGIYLVAVTFPVLIQNGLSIHNGLSGKPVLFHEIREQNHSTMKMLRQWGYYKKLCKIRFAKTLRKGPEKEENDMAMCGTFEPLI